MKKNADFFVAFVGRNFYLEYEVKVQAFNNLGMGPNSTTHTIYSAEGSKYFRKLNILILPNTFPRTFSSTEVNFGFILIFTILTNIKAYVIISKLIKRKTKNVSGRKNEPH